VAALVREDSTMHIAARSPRAAYTLLEVILAMAVAMVLLAGLYTAFTIHLNSTNIGRSLADEANLSRGIFEQISRDVSANLPPLNTRLNQAINLPDGTSTPIGAAAMAANNPSTTTTTTSSNSNTTPAAPASTPVTFNLMVKGTSTNLTLYTLAVPKDATDTLKMGGGSDPTVAVPLSDLRRVSYWFVEGKGLARQEIKMVTSTNDVVAMPPDVASDDPNTTYLPGDIKNVQFQYWDGSAWQDSWDGTTLSTIDNATPQGPPMAIAITLEITRPGKNAGTRIYRHVVAIPTANNLNPTTNTQNAP